MSIFLQNIRLLLLASGLFFLLSALGSGFHNPFWLSILFKSLISFCFGIVVTIIWEKIGKKVWEDFKNIE
jgi:hypothetical protein